MRRVVTKKLVPGMVLADNVYTYNSNQLVLPKGFVLDDKAITKLAFYSIINVLIDEKTVSPDIATVPDTRSYSERLRDTPEFKEFKSDFEDCASNFKNVITDIVRNNKPLVVNDLVSPIYSLISKGKGPSNIFDMIHSLRSYDDATYTHCINVALISNIIGQWLKLSDEDISIATQAGLLHDIGKLLIPGEIITKPAKLTPAEYSIVQTHPQQGYQILRDLPISEHVKNAALMHHERSDGSGYPLHLHGSQIDTFARIVSVADVYDAMTSARVYRGPLCPFIAIQMFETEGLHKYDPNVILTFLQNIVNTYLLNKVRLNDGSEGEIVFINRDHLAKPTIKCADKYIDLSIKHNLYIETIL
ncbi:MAG: HD-GYP domain-containing protein [Butyrivibrio sp.]|nr:HD-GYP domain-containing protein [Butyrivibrio sp.]